MISQIFDSFIFVANGLYFWQAMASVTILAMFVGSIIYNGDLVMVRKAALLITSYASMILLTTFTRIYGNTGLVFVNHRNAYAGMITTACITFFYLVGIYLGVLAHKKGRK
jgi:hypothetical protein